MSNHSVIEHRANYHFVKMEEDYILICSSGKQYPHCKAFILSVLEHWTNDKIAKGQEPYIYLTYPEWIDAMYGLFRRNTVIASMAELESEGLILKRPCKRYGKDTFEYALNIAVVQARIRKLAERSDKNTRPKSNAFKFKRVQKQTDTNLNGKTPDEVQNQTRDPFKSKRNIDSITETPNIDTDYVSAHADSTHVSSEQLNNNPIATTDPTTTPLQAEQGETRNGTLPAGTHRTEPSNGYLLPQRDTHRTKETQQQEAVTQSELSPPAVDKQANSVDKPGKPKKGKEAKVPPSKPVEPSPDMAWGTRKCLQWFDFWRGGQLISTYKLMQASKCAKGLAEQFDEKTVIQVRHTMNNDPYYETRGGCDVCDVANNIHKYLNKMNKNTVKATMGAIKHGPDTDMVEYEGEMMTRDEAMKRGRSDFDIYNGNGKAEREAMIARAKENPVTRALLEEMERAG